MPDKTAPGESMNDISSTRASGPTREHRMLDRATLQAFSTCSFNPGVDSARRPVGGEVDLSFTWQIDLAASFMPRMVGYPKSTD